MEREITAIQAQKHNRDRLNVELEGEFAFGVSRMAAGWLKVGDRLSEERIESILKTDEFEAAYQKATRLIGYRPRTQFEVRQKLLQKGFANDVIDQVLERLTRANLIQDQQYAQMWIENRNEMHPRSQRLMRYELKNKGISEQMIDNALVDSADDSKLAYKAAEEYSRKLNKLDRELFQKRLSAYLARRGFSFEIARPVIESLVRSLEDDQSKILKYEDEEYGDY